MALLSDDEWSLVFENVGAEALTLARVCRGWHALLHAQWHRQCGDGMERYLAALSITCGATVRRRWMIRYKFSDSVISISPPLRYHCGVCKAAIVDVGCCRSCERDVGATLEPRTAAHLSRDDSEEARAPSRGRPGVETGPACT